MHPSGCKFCVRVGGKGGGREVRVKNEDLMLGTFPRSGQVLMVRSVLGVGKKGAW